MVRAVSGRIETKLTFTEGSSHGIVQFLFGVSVYDLWPREARVHKEDGNDGSCHF